MNVGNRLQKGGIAGGMEELRRKYTALLEESDRRGAQRLLRDALTAGHNRAQLLQEVVNPAIETVAEAWEEHHELSLSQIYVAGLIVKDSVETLSLPERAEKAVGKVVFGTAFGDHHGLGKLIVSAFLRSGGFEVVDLGLSVPAKTFVEVALSEGADIIAVSALMIDPAFKICDIRDEMNKRGIKNIVLLVGGAPFRYNPELYKTVGADGTAATAYEAIDVAKHLLEERDARR